MSSPAICLAADCGQLEPWQAVLVVVGAFAIVAGIDLFVRAIQRWRGKR